MLVFLIITCLVCLKLERQKLAVVRLEQQRLEQLVGQLRIDDPEKMQIKMIQRPSRDHIVWRIYLPGNQNWRLAEASVGGGSGWSSVGQSQATEGLLRFRINRDDVKSEIHLIRNNGSSTMSLQPQLADFFETHWDELEVTIAGVDAQVTESVDTIVPLIEIRLPEALQSLAEQELGSLGLHTSAALFQVTLGGEKAFADRDKLEQAKRTASSP